MDIYDILFDEIELFLSGNDISLSNDIYKVYDDALKLIKSGKAEYYPDSVIQWMIAYNLVQLNVDIPIYKESYVLSLSTSELNKLAKSLTLKTTNVDVILQILFYLHKLEEDVNINPGILSVLNPDTIIALLRTMDIDSIGNMCKSSKQIKDVCESTIGRQTIISKLPYDTLDISNYKTKELLFYAKIATMKKTINVNYNRAYIYKNKSLYLFSSDQNIVSKYIDKDNINQIIILDPIMNVLILTNDGKLIHKNLNTNFEYEFFITDKVAGIFQFTPYSVSIITATGNYFTWSGKINMPPTKSIGLREVVQRANKLYLTSKGDVYVEFTKHEFEKEVKNTSIVGNFSESIASTSSVYQKIKNLNNIIQITEYYALSSNGNVYFINPYDYSIQQYPNLNNVTYIVTNDEFSMFNSSPTDKIKSFIGECLDINGNVYNIESVVTNKIKMKFYEKIHLESNIVELVQNALVSAYLDNNNILYIHNTKDEYNNAIYEYKNAIYDLNKL